jgi:hypothetical protein
MRVSSWPFVITATAGLCSTTAAFAQASQTQFDLQCSGQLLHHAMTEMADFKPWRGVVKVDLDAGLFCQDDCTVIEKIQKSGPDEISLKDGSSGFQKGDWHFVRTDSSSVNRRTGQYERSVEQLRDGVILLPGERPTLSPSPDEYSEIYVATCEPAQFTGFPKTRF